jgi:quercetin dioxygenase-like cupin family protein
MTNRDQIEQEWKSRGFSCGLWTDPPGQIWENYVHDVDELIVVLEGKIELQTAGLTQCPEPGEEVLIPAHTVHTVRNVGDTTARWLYGYRKG